MLTVDFTTEQIAFATYPCFNDLHHKLQTQLSDALATNQQRGFVHSVTITVEQLKQIYTAVSQLPEGVARRMNGEMKAGLLPQLFAAAECSSMEEVIALAQTGIQTNEGLNAILALKSVDDANEANIESKIVAGIAQILA